MFLAISQFRSTTQIGPDSLPLTGPIPCTASSPYGLPRSFPTIEILRERSSLFSGLVSQIQRRTVHALRDRHPHSVQQRRHHVHNGHLAGSGDLPIHV